MQYPRRRIGYEPSKSMTRDEFQAWLETQVAQELNAALIQEYLAGFGMKMIWRIVPATEFGEAE
jgi:hypothetical protein